MVLRLAFIYIETENSNSSHLEFIPTQEIIIKRTIENKQKHILQGFVFSLCICKIGVENHHDTLFQRFMPMVTTKQIRHFKCIVYQAESCSPLRNQRNNTLFHISYLQNPQYFLDIQN